MRRRAQVIIYGEEGHPEVRGVPAWVEEKGIAILDPESEIDIPRGKVTLAAQSTVSERSRAGIETGCPDVFRVANNTCPEADARYHAAREPAAACDLLTDSGLTDL